MQGSSSQNCIEWKVVAQSTLKAGQQNQEDKVGVGED